MVIAIVAMFVGSVNAQNVNSGRTEKQITQEDKANGIQEGDKIVVDVFIDNIPMWVVEKENGGFIDYWGNPNGNDLGLWKHGETPSVTLGSGTVHNKELVIVCGRVWCCMGTDNAGGKRCVPSIEARRWLKN